MKNKIFGTAILCMAVAGGYAQTEKDSMFVSLQEQPNAGIYLPAPPDTASLAFASDFLTWQHGKTIRPTARGKQASDESPWMSSEQIRICSETLGVDISKEKTPALYHFIWKASNTSDKSSKAAKEKYMRKRPFAQMNEHTWAVADDEAFLRTNGSYPSGHTSMGWGVALAAAEVAPELQDTIMRRGYQFGENRWIVGAHWRSDVDAGRLCSSASWARWHANPIYYKELEAARKEYRSLKGKVDMKKVGFPNSQRIIAEPVDASSYLFYGDVAATYHAMKERNTSAGQRAVMAASETTADVVNYFAPATSIAITQKTTPAVYALVDYVCKQLQETTSALRQQYFRKRPYVQLGIPTLIPEQEDALRETSSYPSLPSALGWGVALTLTELLPQQQNSILTLGHEFGYLGVVTGYYYASDVQDARLVAAYTLARLHSDDTFMSLMNAAKAEVKR